MHIIDNREIGNKLLKTRKKCSMTQTEVAEASDLSLRTYADIERGTSNMRVDTLLKICAALDVTPNDVLITDNEKFTKQQDDLMQLLNSCSIKNKQTALDLLSVYLKSLD